MSHYKAKTNFSLNGVLYEEGDDVEVKTKMQLIKLNELGYIQPLSAKEIQNFGKPKEINIKKSKEE